MATLQGTLTVKGTGTQNYLCSTGSRYLVRLFYPGS